MGVAEDEIAALQAARKGTALGAKAGGEFDSEIYGASTRGLAREIVDEPDGDDGDAMDTGASHPATRANKPAGPVDDEPVDDDPFRAHREATGASLSCDARARARAEAVFSRR